MDKKVASLVKDVMGRGEKVAPVKSVKLKVKFNKPKSDDKFDAKKKALAANAK